MSTAPPATGLAGRRRTRATPAAFAAAAISFTLLFLSSSTHDGWLVLLAGFGLGLVVAAFLLRPRLDRLDVQVALPPRSRAGGTVDAALAVTNTGTRPTPAASLTLAGHGIASDEVVIRVPPLAGGETANVAIPLRTELRGEIDRLALTTWTTAPLSLLAVVDRRDIPASMLVHPLLEKPLVVAPAGVGEQTAWSSATPGLDVQGVREWHRGEPAGRLYARGSARHGRPLVLDRHDDTGVGLAILVVGSASPLQEALIAVTAGTLVDQANSGRGVAALTPRPANPSIVTLPDVTGPDQQRLLDWCARLRDPSPTFDARDIERAAGLIGRGGSVVVANLGWTQASNDTANWRECEAAAERAGVGLMVLHLFEGRTDALCLHGAAHTHTDEAVRP